MTDFPDGVRKGIPGIVAGCAAVLAMIAVTGAAATAAAQDQKTLERAVQGRQGAMAIHALESGPLFAMAKGDLAYDAEAAAGHAEALHALTGYDETRLFLPGTSNADMPGKTWALPAIWEKPDDFQKAYEALQTSVTELAAQAGDGQEAMKSAMIEVGKACGNCHETFRQKQ